MEFVRQPTTDDLMGNIGEPKRPPPLTQLGAVIARTRSQSIASLRHVLQAAPDFITGSSSLGAESPNAPSRQNFTILMASERSEQKKKSDPSPTLASPRDDPVPLRSTTKALTPTMEKCKEESADLVSLLGLLHRLLSAHELKLTLELLENMIESDLGLVGLCRTNSELVDELRGLARYQNAGDDEKEDALESAMQSSGLAVAQSKAAARHPQHVVTTRSGELAMERLPGSEVGLEPEEPRSCSATSQSTQSHSQSHSGNHLRCALPVRLATDTSPLANIAKEELHVQGRNDFQFDSPMPSCAQQGAKAASFNQDGVSPKVGITGEGLGSRRPSPPVDCIHAPGAVPPFAVVHTPRACGHMMTSCHSSPKNSSNSRGGGLTTPISNDFSMTGFVSLNSQVTNGMLAQLSEEDLGARYRVTKEDDLDDLSIEQTIWLASPSSRCILNPNHAIRVVWDLLSVALIVFECITLPMAMCFSVHMASEVHTVSTTFFFMDIVMSFITGYYHDSLLIMRRDWVVRRYLKTWFLLDIVSTVPWESIVALLQGSLASAGGGSGKEGALLRVMKLGKLMRAVRLLRLTKMGTLLKRLKSSGFLPASMYTLKFGMSACKMFIVFGFLSHWLACGWAMLGQSEDVFVSGDSTHPHDIETCTMGGPCEPGIQGSPWKRRYGLDNYNALTQYWASLQFTAAIMTGGDPPLHAGSVSERVFTIILMICSIFIGSVVVGEVLLIMNRNSEVQLAYDEMVQEAREFMMARKVPMKLQARVYRYLESQHKAPNEAKNQPAFMKLLSTWLAADLVEGLNKIHVCRHPFFKRVLAVTDASVIRRLCLASVTLLHASGDLVVVAGEEASEVFFLVRGKLRVIIKERRGPVYTKAPSWIGDRCLFVDTLRTHSVAAVTSSETTSLHKKEIAAICNEYPQVASVHNHFKRQIMENYGGDIFRCPYCHDLGHIEETCPVKKEHERARACRGKRSQTVSMRSTVSAVAHAISARSHGPRES